MGCALTAMGTEAVGTVVVGGGDGESSEDRALDGGRFCILQDLSWVCAETQTESLPGGGPVWRYLQRGRCCLGNLKERALQRVPFPAGCY